LWLLAMGLQLLLLFPWQPQVLKPGIDTSYYYALNELFVNHVQFAGSVHPHGPYGFLKNDLYHPQTFHLLVGVRLVLFAVFALLAARAASRWAGSRLGGMLWIALLVAVARHGEAYFTSLAMLAFLAFWSASDSTDRARWSPVVLALSLASLMKFNYGLLAVALIGLMVVSVVLERWSGRPRERALGAAEWIAVGVAWPALFLAGILLLWVAAGQEPASAVEYVASRLRFSAGYSESHALAGPTYRILAFLAAGCALWAVFAVREARRSGVRAIAPTAALGLWLALAAKHSFLRYDADHALHGAFQGLCAAAIFGLVMLRRGEQGTRTERRAPALAAIAVMVAASLSLLTYDREHWYGARFFRHLDLQSRAARMSRFVHDPLRLGLRHERALAAIRRAHPLPPLDGTVDVYPWELSLAFAHGLEWDPRPSVGSHMADRPDIALANARHLAAASGPVHVLFRVDSLDHRFPTMDDGPSWLVLLSDFRLRSATGSHLVLDRAQGRRAVEWGRPITRELAFGERLEMAQGVDRLLWLRVDPVRTRRGGLVAAAWRGPIVYLSVELGSGGERWYRLVPGAARVGFLLSPLVADNAGFVALLDGSWPQRLAADRVRALMLHTEFGDGWYWEPSVRVELQELTVR
jgi:hypothetical protein